jgi:outer membrane protein assembly factor BamB
LDFDGRLEVVISGRQGEVWALDAATGKILWRTTRLPGAALLSPLLGSFLDRQRPELALVHQDGALQILRAADGQVVFSGNLEVGDGQAGASFKQDPALLPAADLMAGAVSAAARLPAGPSHCARRL